MDAMEVKGTILGIGLLVDTFAVEVVCHRWKGDDGQKRQAAALAEVIELLYLIPAAEIAFRNRAYLSARVAGITQTVQKYAGEENRQASQMADRVRDTLLQVAETGQLPSGQELDELNQFLRFLSAGTSAQYNAMVGCRLG